MLLTYFLLILSVFAQDDVQPENVNCRERERLITTNKGDKYAIVDAVLGQKILLECRFCNENDESQPKNWFKVGRLGIDQSQEVEVGMENNNSLNRIQVNKEHSLIILNFTEADVGLYKCEKLDGESNKDKLNFLVDLIFKENTTNIETGNITAWAKYHEDYLAPINNLFVQSEGKDFSYIRDALQVHMELMSHWSSWSACEVCGRAKGEGISKKSGTCLIKISLMNDKMTSINPDETYILNANAISCKSQRLWRLFPHISERLRVIPDFLQQQKCDGTCSPDADGANKGWKVGKAKGYKYKHHIVLQEYSHVTLVCPESTLENEVIWRKNGNILKRGSTEDPHIVVDMFNTLYIMEVGSTETGNYTCQVDDIKMQQTRVFVYTKSKLLTGELLRYMTYLGFILFLSSFCYCGGLVITWTKRRTFKTYEELKEENIGKEDSDSLI